MVVTFNSLLEAVGLEPREVALVRHHTSPGLHGQTLADLWQNNRNGFETYQRTQERGRPLFRRPIWAAFVVPDDGETKFVGLYEATLADTRVVEWRCPYRGGAVGKGQVVDVFDTQLRPELAEHIGDLGVDWDPRSVRSWARKAETTQFELLGEPRVGESVPRLTSHTLTSALEQNGFRVAHQTKKLAQMRRDDLVCYIKLESERLPLVVHPRFADLLSRIAALGVSAEEPFGFYINSNLTEFPVYEGGNRASNSRFGVDLQPTAANLSSLIALLAENLSLEAEGQSTRVVGTSDNPLTQVERLQAARIGQGEFRTALLGHWNSTCGLTEIDHPELLRASHIKPWKDSSDAERLDPFNGVLLSALADALFDRGLVTFADDGLLLISSALSSDNVRRLGLQSAPKLTFDTRHLQYLAHHRTHIFRG